MMVINLNNGPIIDLFVNLILNHNQLFFKILTLFIIIFNWRRLSKHVLGQIENYGCFEWNIAATVEITAIYQYRIYSQNLNFNYLYYSSETKIVWDAFANFYKNIPNLLCKDTILVLVGAPGQSMNTQLFFFSKEPNPELQHSFALMHRTVHCFSCPNFQFRLSQWMYFLSRELPSSIGYVRTY